MTADFTLSPRRLEASGLAAIRGEAVIFADIGFALNAGEALLLRGRNGAGKSTLLMVLAGLLRPAAGKVSITGGDAERPSAEDLHLVAHRSAIKPRLTLAENLRFWAAMQGGDNTAIPPALEQVGLGGLDDVDAGHLSAGQTRRLALARLLVSPRPIWLLDEPTAALDIEGHRLVAALIGLHLSAGGLVVAATHDDIAIPAPATIRTLDLGAPVSVPA